MGSNAAACGAKKRVLLLTAIFVVFLGMESSARAQTVVALQKLVLEPKHTEYVYTQNAKTPAIVNVKSSNPSVATASVYRVDRVQIVAVAPGQTDVEFLDTTERILYRVAVWVEKSNATGGGNGYDRTKTQLAQVVMLDKHTYNVTVPGMGKHQISSVRSSNPSVATARTDTVNAIQIYSAALGDTFIDFIDNANGNTFQVHVWVVNNLPDTNGGGGSGRGSNSSGPKPLPLPTKPIDKKPRVLIGSSAGPIDSCLVGTWRSESMINDFVYWDNGGSGIILKIKGDGQVTIDYNGMQPHEHNGSTTTWKGTAAGHITTQQGTVTVASVESADATAESTSSSAQPVSSKLWGLGPPLQSGIAYSYTCDGTILTLNSHVWNSVFRKESND